MIEDLEREGLIRKQPADPRAVAALLGLARRDLATSEHLLHSSNDWCYTIAYNAVLQAGRALMLSRGYRPDGPNQHISVVKFCALHLPENDILIFDRMRRKRHSSVYDAAGTVSDSEAAFAAGQAARLVRVIGALIAA